MRKAGAFAALLTLALAAAPLWPPGGVTQWKMQLLLTEMGAWFGAAALAGAVAAAGRKKPSAHGLILAAVFAGAALLFFRPWLQLLAERPLWSKSLWQVFGDPVPLADQPAPPPRRLTVSRPDGSGMGVLFFPGAGPGPHPWVVAVHTGGWDAGAADEFRWFNARLARRGWSVAAPEYRLAPAHPWPAQRDDVLRAAAGLKARAAALDLDPDRWALLGRSAGGHIAESAAYGARDPSLKGLIAFYAPADLLFAYANGWEDDVVHSLRLLRQLTGGTPAEKPAAYRDASPILHAAPGFPPTLLMHGSRDPLTWPAQSRRLAARLREVGGRTVFIEAPWATHGFDYFSSGPGGRTAIWAAERFLSAVFQKGETP